MLKAEQVEKAIQIALKNGANKDIVSEMVNNAAFEYDVLEQLESNGDVSVNSNSLTVLLVEGIHDQWRNEHMDQIKEKAKAGELDHYLPIHLVGENKALEYKVYADAILEATGSEPITNAAFKEAFHQEYDPIIKFQMDDKIIFENYIRETLNFNDNLQPIVTDQQLDDVVSKVEDTIENDYGFSFNDNGSLIMTPDQGLLEENLDEADFDR